MTKEARGKNGEVRKRASARSRRKLPRAERNFLSESLPAVVIRPRARFEAHRRGRLAGIHLT